MKLWRCRLWLIAAGLAVTGFGCGPPPPTKSEPVEEPPAEAASKSGGTTEPAGKRPNWFGTPIVEWPNLSWGMSETKLGEGFDGPGERKPPSVKFLGLYCPFVVEGFEFAGSEFELFFQFGKESKGLEQILLSQTLPSPRDSDAERKEAIRVFDEILARLIERHGEPSKEINREEARKNDDGNVSTSITYLWELDGTAISFSMIINSLVQSRSIRYFSASDRFRMPADKEWLKQLTGESE